MSNVLRLRELCEKCAQLEDRCAAGQPGENLIGLGDELRRIIEEEEGRPAEAGFIPIEDDMVEICKEVLEKEDLSDDLAWGKSLAQMKERLGLYRRGAKRENIGRWLIFAETSFSYYSDKEAVKLHNSRGVNPCDDKRYQILWETEHYYATRGTADDPDGIHPVFKDLIGGRRFEMLRSGVSASIYTFDQPYDVVMLERLLLKKMRSVTSAFAYGVELLEESIKAKGGSTAPLPSGAGLYDDETADSWDDDLAF